jgi:glycosyltransferase involved in cell wall biosynthesis
MSMRILLAVHHFPPRFTGGAEWRAWRTAKALSERGHEIRVVCVESIHGPAGGGIKAEVDEYNGVVVERLSFDLAGCPDPFRWGYDNPLIGDYIDTRLTDFRPDVFHLVGGYLISGRPLLIAQEKSIPTVVSLTDYWFLCPRISMIRSNGRLATVPIDPEQCGRCLAEERRRFRWPAALAPGLMDKYWETNISFADKIRQRQAFLNSVLMGVNAVVSPSRFLRSMFVESGIPREKILYCRQGLSGASAQTAPPRRHSPRPEVHIGYVGQIASHKGVHVLLKAALKVPDDRLRVFVYGDTRAHPEYVRRLKSLIANDRRIRLAGLVLPAELARVYSDLDALVVPSLWYENSPNVILEAQGHAVPVIASNLGGMAEMVRPEADGLLFSPGDDDELARQLQRLVHNPELLEALSGAAPKVKTLDEEMNDLVDIYRAATKITAPALA